MITHEERFISILSAMLAVKKFVVELHGCEDPIERNARVKYSSLRWTPSFQLGVPPSDLENTRSYCVRDVMRATNLNRRTVETCLDLLARRESGEMNLKDFSTLYEQGRFLLKPLHRQFNEERKAAKQAALVSV